MAKYIDRDAFIKEQCHKCDGWCNCVGEGCDCLNCTLDERCDFIKELAEFPSIEIVSCDAANIHLFDVEETHENCLVQILRNRYTGEYSIGWKENEEPM